MPQPWTVYLQTPTPYTNPKPPRRRLSPQPIKPDYEFVVSPTIRLILKPRIWPHKLHRPNDPHKPLQTPLNPYKPLRPLQALNPKP